MEFERIHSASGLDLLEIEEPARSELHLDRPTDRPGPAGHRFDVGRVRLDGVYASLESSASTFLRFVGYTSRNSSGTTTSSRDADTSSE